MNYFCIHKDKRKAMLRTGICLGFWILIISMLPHDLSAQGDNNQCYEYLNFKDFLTSKIQNDTDFVRQIYMNVQYPEIAIEYEIEGMIELVLISHSNKEFEILILNQPITFKDLEGQVRTAISKLDVDQSKPFMTRFKISFNLDTPRNAKESYEKSYLGLIDDEMFTIMEYRVPLQDVDH